MRLASATNTNREQLTEDVITSAERICEALFGDYCNSHQTSLADH